MGGVCEDIAMGGVCAELTSVLCLMSCAVCVFVAAKTLH